LLIRRIVLLFSNQKSSISNLLEALMKQRLVHTGLILIAMIGGVLLTPSSVQADIAPPEYPQGANLLPGSETTQVRMESEQVKLTVVSLPAGNAAGRAKVEADFQMQNEGSADEIMEVRFPLSILSGRGSGWGEYPEIADLLAWVNGARVTTTRVETPAPGGESDHPLAWAAFKVTFPAGKPVPIRITYTAEGVGEYPNVHFTYVLQTGAGWKGTIGKADLTVTLPYPANNLNVIVPWSSEGLAMNGSDLTWHRENFEPGEGDDLVVALMQTGVWNTIRQEKNNVQANPNDGEAWGRLGKIYKESLQNHHEWRDDDGGQQIYQLSVAAYDKAVTLKPKDALWHYGFADLLWYHFRLYSFYLPPSDLAGLTRALQELKSCLDLDPSNQDARYMVSDIQQMVPGAIEGDNGQYTWPGLTATPVVTPFPSSTPFMTDTPAPTETLAPTDTLVPSLTPTQPATSTPEPSATSAPTRGTVQGQADSQSGELAKKPSLPICGAGVILPLAILAGFGLLKRIRSI
jgi:hypothetical protein